MAAAESLIRQLPAEAMDSDSERESDSPETQSENESRDMKALISLYSNYIWNRFAGVIPNFVSPLIGKFATSYRQFARARSRRGKLSLPLPLPSKVFDSSLVMTDASMIFDVLEDILERIFLNLHVVQKNLQYWQAKAEGSDAWKAYFMLFERGPRAFIGGTVQFIRNFVTEESALRLLCHSSSSYIAESITILDSLRYTLAKFLAQVYMEIDRHSEDLVSDPQKAFQLLLIAMNNLFSDLEASIGELCAACQVSSTIAFQKDSSVGGTDQLLLLFSKLPKASLESSTWTDSDIHDAVDIIHQNLDKLDSYLAALIAKHHKPRRATRYWVRYTCGVVGLSVCSAWLLRHSSFVGSPDIDNWIREGKESMITFWSDHVEQPLLSIRDELFETFRKRHKGMMEVEEVQLTANSLHRMLSAFCEQTNGQKLPENASEQEMLEIVMSRYEKELMHPIKNILGGELARALLIQVQKLKLDIETAMLELDQILKANEINFAILAALPAFFLSFLLLMVVRSWIKQDKGAEGRGRIARLHRRLLIVEVEKKIMNYQTCLEKGQEQDAQCMFGLALYSLDLLYRAAERHAKGTGEWRSLRQDIIELAKPDLQTAYKLTITSRMERVYDCLLPSFKH